MISGFTFFIETWATLYTFFYTLHLLHVSLCIDFVVRGGQKFFFAHKKYWVDRIIMAETDSTTEVPDLVERPSPPPDSALALRQGTAGSVKRLQANGMKPTIIEDSETSDEDAIIR